MKNLRFVIPIKNQRFLGGSKSYTFDTNHSKLWGTRKKIEHSTDKNFICNKCEWGLPYIK